MDKRHNASELFALAQYSIPEEIEKALNRLEPLLLSAAQNGCTSLTLSPVVELGVTEEFTNDHLVEPLRNRGFVVGFIGFGFLVSWAQASMADVLSEAKLRG